jgi:hypothetical protein
MSDLGKRIILAIPASIALVFAQIIFLTLFPVYGATPGTIMSSVVFLNVLFTKRGFKWTTAAKGEWWLFGIQFLVILFSRAMSSYYQNWVCKSADMTFLECLDQSGTLAKFGDGIGTIILVAMTIWLFVRQPTTNDRAI